MSNGKLNKSKVDAAVAYNRKRKLDKKLVAKLRAHLELDAGDGLDERAAQAVAKWQSASGLSADGKVGGDTLALLEQEWGHDASDDDDGGKHEPPPARSDSSLGTPSFEFVDLRGLERQKKRGKPARGPRSFAKITGITLHQTACVFRGPHQKAVLNVPVHSMTFADGQVALLNPADAYMSHGHGLNRSDIGIEVSCNAAGIEGVFNKHKGDKAPNTFWRSVSTPNSTPVEATDEQLEITRQLVRYYVELVRARGGELKHIHAHRQSAGKPADPGSRIWKAVGLWAQKEFGLTHSTKGLRKSVDGTHLEGGSAIPTAWDPEVEGVPYSWKVKGY